MKRVAAAVLALGGSALVARLQGADAGPLHVPPDLALDEVLKEPVVAQPVFLNFDTRGRMWVVQYRQYPDPAGLKAVSRDEFWRTIYDRKKPAPPYDTPEKAAFRGRDRITIHEDVNHDGTFAKTTTFLDGLNITTAVCRGRGGVWVLTPPHLMFYPDANDDDVPDGPPTVHLEGFGIEDTHSMANSLRWGPDGWLYGAQGSTVTAEIVRPGLDRAPIAHLVGQCIWRYDPASRRFEVFAEGGGNAFNVEIDAKGRIFSGHNGGNTRGFHYVQGGYLAKGFEKHGDLSNPYAFGYFPQMPHPALKRFSHGFIIYEGNALPAPYRGKLVAIDPLNGYVSLTEITPRGATFQTRDLEQLIPATDKRFRPVDIKHGPDGAIYIADWYDLLITHTDNVKNKIGDDDGRIYRVRAANAKPGMPMFDLTKKTSRELVELLRSDNRAMRELAQQVLADRRDASLIEPLRAALRANQPGQFALEALWALNLSGGFDEAIARELFKHPDPYVRLWSVRLLGDRGLVGRDTAEALTALATSEENVEVRSQLAASAKRLAADPALPVIRELLTHDADVSDPYVPLQLWWAIESKCASDAAAVIGAFDAATWTRPLVQRFIASRLMRRFAAAGGTENLLRCAALLERAPDAATKLKLMEGFEQAFEGRALPSLPDALVAAMIKAGGGSLALRVRQKDPAALDEALRVLADPQRPVVERLRLIAVFGEVNHPPAAPVLGTLASDRDAKVRAAALGAAANYDDATLTRELIAAYGKLSSEEKEIAQSALTSRNGSAAALLDAIDAGAVDRKTIQPQMRDKMRLLGGGALAARVDRTFGRELPPQPEHLQKEIDRVIAVVNSGRGDPYRGRVIWEQTCAGCHKLHGKGGEIGPDLTSFARDDVASIALNVVNPNAQIREGYEMFVATTKAGAVHSGFLVTQDKDRVVLRDMAGVSSSLARDQLASLQGAGRSLMPDGLLTGRSDEELRDLFAYLRTTQPLVIRRN